MTTEPRRTTIIDVARVAGVSYKTVSRVLNGEPHVKSELRERVTDAAKRLNYHPNVQAQGLVRKRSFLIGLVSENPSSSYGFDLQMGVLDRLRNERYRLLVVPIGSTSEHAAEVVTILRAAALDGVVLAPPAADHPLILADLAAARMPFARVAPTRLLEIGHNNLVDDVAAAREIAEHVLSLGHREIGIVKGDATHRSSEARMIGYTAAMQSSGVPVRMHWIEQGNYTFDSGLHAGRRLFAGHARPTAVLVQNDDMAVGVMMAAREAGLSVPDDISITGFDDSEFSRMTWPRLTTVRQPVFDMARGAADMLLAQLERRPLIGDVEHVHTLVVRDSTGAPRA